MNQINKQIDWLTIELIEGNEDKVVFYKKNNNILGFYYYEINNQILSLLIYVYEKDSEKNIEIKMYQEIMEKTKNLDFKRITTEFLDNKNSINFFKRAGFKIDYISVKMVNQLNKVNNDILNTINKTDISMVEKYYDHHFDEVNLIASEAFYSLNKANDLKPYYSYWDEKYRKYLNNDNLDCFIIKKNNEIIGFSILKDNEIDKVLVNPKYQGRGYGKLLTIHAIKCIENKGYDSIYLFRLINNPIANKLYQSLGFVSVGNIVIMSKEV